MPSDAIPCPRCSEPTPPVRDACRHCDGSLSPTTADSPGIGQHVLAYGAVAAWVATAIAVLASLVLAVAAPERVFDLLPVTAFCFASALYLLVVYRWYCAERAAA